LIGHLKKIPSGYLTWPIEINGLPNKKMDKNGGSFHGKLLNNQKVYIYICKSTDGHTRKEAGFIEI
jgi:hypothetical protein